MHFSEFTLQVTHPWPISPIKTKSQVHVPSFIEMSFSDDDDEEEYVPDDVETVSYADICVK